MEEKKVRGGYWKGWLKRFLTLLVPAFFLCFTGVFFGPLDIVNANQMYLTFAAGDLLFSVAWVTVAASVVIAAVFALIPGKAHRLAFALLLGISVLFYFQGALLNGDLGTLDGTEFDWRGDAPAAYKNLAIWTICILAIMALGWFFPDIMRTAGFIVCAALVVAQGVSLATTWVPKDDSVPNYQLSGEEQFTLSSDENILVLTLDQLSPLIFEEALERDPHFYDVFKDFLYFDNMSSRYSFTFPSLMYLLTGNELDLTVPTREAVYNAWHSEKADNFYDTLHENGYQVNLFLESNYAALGAENMLGKADNIVEAGDLVITPQFFEFLIDMSLYRYMPTILKNPFCVSTGGIVDVSAYQGVTKLRINYDFYEALQEEGLTLTDDHKVFNWYHMQGAHFPYVVDYDGYLCDEDETNREDQLHGYLLALEEYFDQLKQIGVYDDATIIISADHGYFECFQAAFLIKLPGQTFEEFTTTSAPVAQGDIIPTILSLVGGDYSDYCDGTTVYDWEEGDHRMRTTSVWGYMRSYPEVEWIGNIDQWDAEANGVERYNVFGTFRYDGDRDTIMSKERYWYYYGVADAIEPLYDSFY